ncbi:hypothetical protein CAPTEDRAFT_125354 [Capitella teleta]|uniref:2-C-methyl-D-erythritol 4-phosphate cytidylyltransferase-like protein n=1 Tax=Capitella teleta TaxID=283909 RepID=R7TBE1_CAPTE|nr:hypothetical protein CAPTEDRAFT_125354 [Capitella teleta]|eukprot:ELT91058.1 hypothetical protein CAPTEDRAFT_125354 [Capitella teleta]
MSTFDDSKIDLEVYVVIPAAGCGVRFGSLPPKQLQLLGNQPLICRTVSAFESIPWISQIIVPTSADLIDHLTAIFHDHGFLKVKTCLGSATRHRSIFNGIIALEKVCSADSVVIIHDAVRPFVNQSTVASVTMAAHLHKAAGVTRPLVSTVISCDDHSLLKESLDRNRYQASEMPQAFQYNVIRSAYENCCTHDFDHGTECLHLALKYCDVRAKLIEGSEHLWKVTYRRDLLAAEMTLRGRFQNLQLFLGTGTGPGRLIQ